MKVRIIGLDGAGLVLGREVVSGRCQEVEVPELFADGQVRGQVNRPSALEDLFGAAGSLPVQSDRKKKLVVGVANQGELPEAELAKFA